MIGSREHYAPARAGMMYERFVDGRDGVAHVRAEEGAEAGPGAGAEQRTKKGGHGRLTSGGYSVHFGKSIGMGYVTPGHAAPGTKLEVKKAIEHAKAADKVRDVKSFLKSAR